jgi:hypothetical protein
LVRTGGSEPSATSNAPRDWGAGALTLTYTLPSDGEVTLGLYSSAGALLRTIIKSEFRLAGPLKEPWDGLDQWGNAIPPGTYELRGVYHPHISTTYVTSFGNPGIPPWPTPDGRGDWLSDEAPPQGAATDGRWVFLAAPGSEKGYSIIGVDETGRRRWGTKISFNPCTVSLAVDRDTLFALFSGPQLTDSSHHFAAHGTNAIGRAVLVRLDKRTGQPSGFSLRDPALQIASWPYVDNLVNLWDLRKARSFSPSVYTGQPRYANQEFGEATNAIGLAASNGLVYVTMHDDDKILVLKEDTGLKVDEIHVIKPAGLIALPNNRLLAISDKSIVQIDPASKEVRTVTSRNLSAPRSITVDKNGTIFVSDWGDSFQVKMFSARGSALGTIGKRGGRPWLGKWDSSGMLLPTGIAVTDTGKLWVAEDDSSPNRVSVWDTTTRELVKEYLGPTSYGGGVPVVDPTDPTIAYSLGLRLKLDYASNAYFPLATIDRRMDIAQPFFRPGFSANVGGHIAYHDGHEYLIFFNEHHLTISERRGELFVPVAALGGLFKGGLTQDGTDWNIWDSDLGTRTVANYFPPFFKGHAGANYAWSDQNGDGLVQPNEMNWHQALGRGDRLQGNQVLADTYWGIGIGPDWSVYWGGFCADASVIYRLDVKGWTPSGTPIYDINDSKPIITRDNSMSPTSISATRDNHIVVNYGYENTAAKNTFEYFDRNGNSIWAVARVKEQGLKDIQYESIAAELQAPGIGAVFASWAWHGNYLPYLFTDDGLYLSSLTTIGRLGPDAGWDESFKAYYQDPRGVPFMINGAADANHMLQITGLEGGRFQEQFKLTQAEFDRGLRQRTVPSEPHPPSPIINVSWTSQSPIVDGNLTDWDLNTGVKLHGNAGREATIALARDDKNLYLAAHVSKDSPYSNKGTNWQTLFISGDCVDLMLSIRPESDPHRANALPGDQRLLFSEFQGKPIAVLYRPVVPGTRNAIQLGAARLDQITKLDSARVTIVSHGNSYDLEAAIPLAELDIPPNESRTLHGDVGAIFADESGASRAQRLYFYNAHTMITADLTTEATLQPREWGEIEMPLGANLIRNSGFEYPLSSTSDGGWQLKAKANGADARIDSSSPHSGQHTLLLVQSTPVTFPSDAYNTPSYSDFLRSANGATGGGHVEVEQVVPVKEGHQYSFRIHYRSQGLRQEIKTPSPDRGYSRLNISITWMDVNKPLESVHVLDERRNIAYWNQLTNWIANDWSVNKPYVPPAGANQAIITLDLDTVTANDLPTVSIDDLEFIDAPLTF